MSLLRESITRADGALLAFLVVATLLAVPMSVMAAGDADGTATITGPQGQMFVALDSPGTYVVEGLGGDVVFEVAEGQISCIESSCEEQICVKLHTVTSSRPVVCAPNGVTAVLTGVDGRSGDGGLDAVSR